MRRPEIHSLWTALLVFLTLCGCEGTSTDTENTITAAAYLADGRPAAGAILDIRSGDLVVSPQDVPSWKSLATRTADAKGRFSEVLLPQDGNIFVEIRQSPADTAPGHSPQIYFVRYAQGDPRPNRLGAITLSPSGALKGRLGTKPGESPANRWIGVMGSSVLVKLDSTAGVSGLPFQLNGLYPGRHELSVVLVGLVGAAIASSYDKPSGVVQSDSVTDMGTIPPKL